MKDLSADYWDNRFRTQNTGWDLGKVSPPLKAYIDQLEDKSLRILIPGAGNAYEAEYLFQNGFKNVFVVDFSETALENLHERVPEFPSEQILHDNFFNMEGQFDLILEQAFFCALDPSLREQYVQKMHDLLSEKGKLVGLLFNKALYNEQPPFGGHKRDYLAFFESFFQIHLMEESYNSLEKRKGLELFIILQKKD